jgi:1-acyl-sn-glycerol-3-phosphate acyltransferase
MYHVLRVLSYLPVRVLWLGRVVGLQKIDKKDSFIIAANHTSYLDFILLFILLPRKISFLAAEKFFRSSFWRPIMQWTGQIKVDRQSEDKTEVYKNVDRILKEGRVLGIFPEGTRSRTGKINKAYNGVAKFAYKYKIPVVPVGIKNAYSAWSPQMSKPKIKKCDIIIGEPIYINNTDFDVATRNIMKNIANLVEDTYEY